MKSLLRAAGAAVFAVLLCSCVGSAPAPKDLSALRASPSWGWVVGHTLTVELVENATTGYRWSRPVYDPALFELVSDKFIAPESRLAGAPGKRVFVFRGAGVGTGTIATAYVRPWEKNSLPAASFLQRLTLLEERDGTPDALLRIDGDIRFEFDPTASDTISK